MSHRPQSGQVKAVGVTIPVHDEELLLPSCLRALDGALARLPDQLRVQVAIVLDCCSDGSSAIAMDWAAGRRAVVVECSANSVGVARRLGCATLLRGWPRLAPTDIWLATTDADSEVPENWLTAQLQAGDGGADLWAGRVTVSDWSQFSPRTSRQWARVYEREVAPIHGASLGIRGHAYLQAGGFQALTSGEDRDLHDRALGLGFVAHYDATARVSTSARRVARAPRGFAHLLNDLEHFTLAAGG
jgi:hypothetical protein